MDIFATQNILFSIEGVGYVNNSDYFSYEREDFDDLIAESPNDNAIDIYFLPPGVYNNGESGGPSTSSVVIGGGTSDPNGCSTDLIPSSILAHEIGHNLGLLHTFEFLADEDFNFCFDNTSDCECGDLVSDTGFDVTIIYHDPPEYVAPGDMQDCIACNCTFNSSTNINPKCKYNLQPEDYPLNNLMSYSPMDCRTELTPGQGYRVRRYLNECLTLQEVVATEQVLRITEGFHLVYDDPFFECHPDIYVEAGGRLTLTVPLEFEEGKGIYIEEGGRVDVEGVTLSGCSGGSWHGIEVTGNGDRQFPSVPNGQGYLNLEAGSELINAESPIIATRGGLCHSQFHYFHQLRSGEFQGLPQS